VSSAETSWKAALENFARANEASKSFLVLDLDGTALLEDHGKVFISSSVEKGVKAVYDLNLPVVLNTLRFPLSVISTIGEAWSKLSNVPILTVLLNGSLLGQIRHVDSQLHFEELTASPMVVEEIQAMLEGIDQLLKAKIKEFLFFFYPRDWKKGETLWTPNRDKVTELKKKFVSASRVFSSSMDELRQELSSKEICMTSLFIDRPEDSLMAYQHSKRNNFFTATGVSKKSGLRAMAKRLGLNPVAALGAGDTEMDNFLSEVGLAVIVGQARLGFRGRLETIRVPTPLKLGELILSYAELLKGRAPL
jgi:hydroxymethylpyrimidine pyrophosphatase-like HAD family hydrolase